MSYISTFVAVLIMLIRWILGKKLPAFFSYILWIILLVRLVTPMTFASECSMFNYLPPMNNIEILYEGSNKNNQQEEDTTVRDESVNKKHRENANLTSRIWMSGAISLIIVFSIGYIFNMNKFREGIIYNSHEINNIIKFLYKKNIKIYTVEWIDTPLVCGIFKPKIIVPTHITKEGNEDILKAVTLHEIVHIKRKDNIIKLLFIFAICIHWFNPVVWIAFVLFNKDMEEACDEKVMGITKGNFKKKYAEALLNFALDKNNITTATILSFGESNIKKRISRILKYKEAKFFTKLITITIFIGAILLTITDGSKNIIEINLNILEKERQENWVDLDHISPLVVQAAIVSQDQDFYYHNGVDLLAIGRSSINSLVLRKDIQGASTITMQLIKNVCEYKNINILEKKRTQIYSAVQLEKNYSKEEIIEAYFNSIYYGRNIRGIKDASQFYFDKTPLELTKGEACKLIAVLDNPKEYDILNEKENNERKANLINSKISKINMEESNEHDKEK